MVVMMLMTVGAMMMMVVMVMMTAERINYMMPLLIDTWPICLLNPCDAALQQSLEPITNLTFLNSTTDGVAFPFYRSCGRKAAWRSKRVLIKPFGGQ